MYPGYWIKTQPTKPAVIDSESKMSVTYEQLDHRSNQLSQYLWEAGLRKGDHIALFMENNLRYFEVVWAALRSGLFITPINRYLSAEEAGYITHDCEAKVLITSFQLSEPAIDIPKYTPECEIFLMVGGSTEHYQNYEESIADYSNQPLKEQPTGSLMLYSSGTTGKPKGIYRDLPKSTVDQGHSSFVPLQQALWGLSQDTVYLSPAPLYHASPIAFCLGVQSLGGTVVMMPKFNEQKALAYIDEFKVTHSQWVPTMFSRMLKLPEEVRNQYSGQSHKVAIHAAAPCPKAVKEQMMNWWGPILYEYYGGSELNGLTHISPQEWLEKPGSVGKPIVGIAHICDENGNELPAGQPGKIYFELPVQNYSYYGDDAKTKDSFHPSHDNWTALGDVGYVDTDGYLFLTDRESFMIISGGVNIYPQEIEDTLILHPSVFDVAVVGVPNQDMGEEVKAVVQLIKGDFDQSVLEQELIDYCHRSLAKFKCPKSVDFIDEIPRLPTGKLYKRILKDRYWGNKDSKIV